LPRRSRIRAPPEYRSDVGSGRLTCYRESHGPRPIGLPGSSLPRSRGVLHSIDWDVDAGHPVGLSPSTNRGALTTCGSSSAMMPPLGRVGELSWCRMWAIGDPSWPHETHPVTIVRPPMAHRRALLHLRPAISGRRPQLLVVGRAVLLLLGAEGKVRRSSDPR